MKTRFCFIAPAIVMVIMMLVFACYRMFPFGDKTLSWCDMNQQIIPFLMDIKDILSGKASMFLNMQNAGGISFWGVFLFFISSPFTFIVMLVSKSEMYYFANILIILKMMTCAFTSSFFFRKQFHKLNVPQNVALSLMYAFCGYTMFYYQNQVWLDVMYLFPILLLGLILLVEKDQVLPYILSFSLIIIVNFYLSYMIAIFVVLAFGTYLILCAPKKLRRKNILLFGISTLIVGLVTAVAWLPSLLQYINSARTGNLITSLKGGSLFTQFDTVVVVILCTGAIFTALLIYPFISFGHIKRKTFALCIFIITLLPIFLEPINKMWHTGSYQAFPVRYGFIPIFFGLILFAVVLSAANASIALKKRSYISIICSILTVVVLFIAAYILITKNFETLTIYTKTLWGDKKSFVMLLNFFILSGIAYFLILVLYYFKQLSKTAFCSFLCTIVIIEAFFNSCVYIGSAANEPSWCKPILNLSGQIKDNDLYRVKTNKKYFDVNLVGGMGYNTLNHYTSLTNKSFMYTMKKLGYSSYWMEVNSNGGTEFTDAILGNRYTIIRIDEIKSIDKIVYQNSEYAIKKNSITLPIGFVINTNDINSLQKISDTTRLNTQQSLFQSVFNTNEQLIINYEPAKLDNINISKNGNYLISFIDKSKKGSITYNIAVKGTQTLYFDCFDLLSNSLYEHIDSTFKILVNGTVIQDTYPNQWNNGLLNLGIYTDENVQVQVDVLKELNAKSFGLEGLHLEVLNNAVNNTIPAQLKQKNNSIVGTAAAQSENSYLFLPLIYGDGYTIHVNNKETEPLCVFDSMIAFKLEKGENTVSISYAPPGFKTGASLCGIGVFLLAAYLIFLKKGLYPKLKFFEIPAAVLFWLLCIGTFIIVYIFPLAIHSNRE